MSDNKNNTARTILIEAKQAASDNAQRARELMLDFEAKADIERNHLHANLKAIREIDAAIILLDNGERLPEQLCGNCNHTYFVHQDKVMAPECVVVNCDCRSFSEVKA